MTARPSGAAAPNDPSDLSGPDGDTRVFVYDPTDPTRYGEVRRFGVTAFLDFQSTLRSGRPVACIPFDAVFALDQAADFLNLPLSAVHKAVCDGRLATTGPHAAHVRFADLHAYRALLLAARREAVRELSEIDRELRLEG